MTTFDKTPALIRQEETMQILSNYNTMTPQKLLDYLLSHHYDSDCQYIFNNLPKYLQDIIDELAGEIVKIRDKQIADVKKQREHVEQQIDVVKAYNQQLDRDIYQIEHQLELSRELGRQLS